MWFSSGPLHYNKEGRRKALCLVTSRQLSTGGNAGASASSERREGSSMPDPEDDTPDAPPPTGGDEGASPGAAPPSSPGAPPGPPPSGPGGAPTLAPSSAPTSLPVRAAGAQAVMRNTLRQMVTALMKFSPNFEFDTPEGKAIRGAINSLGPVFAKKTDDRSGAITALMARAAQGRANQMPGGPPGAGPPGGAAMPGPPGGGPPPLPRGPVPMPGGPM